MIFLTLKGIKKGSFEEAYRGMQSLIADEFERHSYLLKSELLSDKVQDNQYLFENSLKLLIRYLNKHHNERVIVLIDEYDTPILDSYLCAIGLRKD